MSWTDLHVSKARGHLFTLGLFLLGYVEPDVIIHICNKHAAPEDVEEHIRNSGNTIIHPGTNVAISL